MRITSKGQVTIPIQIREKAGLLPHTEVDFIFDGETVTLVRSAKPSAKKPSRGEQLVEHMKEVGRRLRAEGKLSNMTTDEIMELTRGE